VIGLTGAVTVIVVFIQLYNHLCQPGFWDLPFFRDFARGNWGASRGCAAAAQVSFNAVNQIGRLPICVGAAFPACSRVYRRAFFGLPSRVVFGHAERPALTAPTTPIFQCHMADRERSVPRPRSVSILDRRCQLACPTEKLSAAGKVFDPLGLYSAVFPPTARTLSPLPWPTLSATGAACFA
jgi:hypothetical protein